MRRLFSLAVDAFWLIVAVAIVLGGYLGFQTLGALKSPVEATAVERALPVVSVAPLTRHSGPLPIRGEGFIRAKSSVGLGAQVSGRIAALHPAVASRGLIEEGAVVARLDDRAAQAQLDRTLSDIASVTAQLELAETQADRAKALFERGVIAEDRLDQSLTQQTQLRAQLTSLQAAKASARIQLDNTVVRAPFDARVLSQSADLGDVVNPGQTIATLISADTLEVTIPLTLADAALIPGLFQGDPATATVSTRFANRTLRWPATVERVSPDLDPRTRTLGVTLQLSEPGQPGQGANDLPSGNPPALINGFAAVTIDGATMQDVYAIPTTSLRPENTVWLVDEQDRIVIRAADSVHVDGETSFVRIAPAPAAGRIVTSSLDGAVEGMRIVIAQSPAVAANQAE